MQDLGWNDKYLIGELHIDKQHKKLFEIAGRAFQAVSANEKITKIKTIVSELIQYTQTHFSSEEKFMEKISYPYLKEHKEKHDAIIAKMNKFLKSMTAKKVAEIEKELAKFVGQWFINHIITEDKKVAAWAKNHQGSAKIEWKNIYKIGEENIDKQHKELFNIANEALSCRSTDNKKQVIKETLVKLYKYVQIHFQDEEAIMEKIKFKDIDEHKASHEKIIENLTNLVKNSNKLSINELESVLSDFIYQGIIEHILKDDMQIAQWINYQEDLKTAKDLN